MTKGKELWQLLEKRGREKYNLDESWLLCAVNLKDDEIAEIEFGKKNEKGKWLKGKDNEKHGIIIWKDLNDKFT